MQFFLFFGVTYVKIYLLIMLNKKYEKEFLEYNDVVSGFIDRNFCAA